MKNLLLLLLLILNLTKGLTQGTIHFYNYIPPVVITHVYAPRASDLNFRQVGNGTADFPAGAQDWSDFKLIGAGGIQGPYGAATTFAQLLGASGFDQPEAILVPGNPTATFRTGPAAGYITSTVSTLVNVPFFSPATLQMVAWDNSSGLYPTWNEAVAAWQAGLIAAGRSPTWNQFFAGPLADPPKIYGARSFNLYYLTPEPSPLALATLAAAMWLVFRHHSNKHNTQLPD